MACPHVSGVVSLGLAYAKKLGKKFTREQFTSMLLTSVNNIDQFCSGTKMYGYTSISLDQYKGKMGTGQVDAYAFLSAIAESGTDMTFPNVFVALDGQTVISPSIYFENGAAQTYTVSVENSAVASCEVNGNKLIFKGLAEGQTSATLHKTCRVLLSGH